MNDIRYLDLQFKGDIMETTILHSLNDIESLNYYMGYVKGAVNFHIKENNPKQVEFFQAALDLCIKKQNKLMRRKMK